MDRTLLRAGQTVSMKSHARRELLTGPRAGRRRGAAHHAAHRRTRAPATTSTSRWRGAPGRYAETVYKIPDDAKLGVYDVSAVAARASPCGTGSFRVEEFRLPAMIGRLVPPAGPQVDPRELTMDVMVNYGNGGGAANLPLRVSAQVRDIDLSQRRAGAALPRLPLRSAEGAGSARDDQRRRRDVQRGVRRRGRRRPHGVAARPELEAGGRQAARHAGQVGRRQGDAGQAAAASPRRRSCWCRPPTPTRTARCRR